MEEARAAVTAELRAANDLLKSEVAERTAAQHALCGSEERFSKAFEASAYRRRQIIQRRALHLNDAVMPKSVSDWQRVKVLVLRVVHLSGAIQNPRPRATTPRRVNRESYCASPASPTSALAP